jgi:predicted Zn-ribbon and HTH transcriptional regulator
MTECPKCKSQKITRGRLSVNGRSKRLAMAFIPGDLKWYQFSLEGGAELKQEVYACSDCGMVWTTVAYPENLRAAVSRSSKTAK